MVFPPGGPFKLNNTDMKKCKRILLTAMGLALFACSRERTLPERLPGSVGEILFSAAVPLCVDTRTAQTTSLDAFYVNASYGDEGEESPLWQNAQFSLSGDVYRGRKLWPLQEQDYHFYASNVPMEHGEDGAVVLATNATDVVCAYLPDPVYGQHNVLVFRHIFACVGQVTVWADTGCTVTDIEIRMTPVVGGTYNIRTGDGQTDGTGWSDFRPGEECVIASSVGANPNDLFLVPGVYTVQARWTCEQGGSTATTTRRTYVDLPAGQRSRLSFALGEDMFFGIDVSDI